MNGFDFNASAELYASTGRGSSKRPMSYHRFDTGALAIRYAIETLPAERLFGSILEVGEDRFDAAGIRRLYESPEYPLERKIAP